MVMTSLRSGASASIMKFILFGLLLLAVGGMVFMDIGGFFRNGVSGSHDIARAGGENLSLTTFDRGLRRTLARANIDPGTAYRLGYTDQLLNGELRSMLLQKAADRHGIRIPEQRVAQQIKDMIAPMVPPGGNAQDVFSQMMLSQGMNEGELVNGIARDISTRLMVNTIKSGFAAVTPDIARDLYAFQHEKRDIRYIVFRNDDIKDVPQPDDAKLQALYEAMKETYAIPEKRVYQIIKLQTAHLEKTIEITDADIKDFYDSNIDQYNSPETRTVDQALLDKEEDAAAIAALLKEKHTLKDAVQKQTGNLNAYLGVRKDEMEKFPAEVQPALEKAAQIGQVIGPVKTGIGWYVMVVESVDRAHQKTLEQARDDIRKELLETKLIDQKYALSSAIDDAFAGGASLDDIKKQFDVTVSDLPESSPSGLTAQNKDVFADYGAAREQLSKAATALNEGDTSPMMDLADGGFVALHVSHITPKAYKSFADVQSDLRRKWIADQKSTDNRLKAAAMLTEIKEGKTDFAGLAARAVKSIQTARGLSRTDTPAAPLSQTALLALFLAPAQEPQIVDLADGLAIAMVDKITLADAGTIATKDKESLEKALLEESQNEALMAYLESLRVRYGAYVNRPLLERAYGRADDTAAQ